MENWRKISFSCHQIPSLSVHLTKINRFTVYWENLFNSHGQDGFHRTKYILLNHPLFSNLFPLTFLTALNFPASVRHHENHDEICVASPLSVVSCGPCPRRKAITPPFSLWKFSAGKLSPSSWSVRRAGNHHCIHNEAGLAVGKMAARFAGQQSCNSPEKLLLDFNTVNDFIFHAVYIWATSWENLFLPYANNKGADQTVNPRSLISIFVVHSLGLWRHTVEENFVKIWTVWPPKHLLYLSLYMYTYEQCCFPIEDASLQNGKLHVYRPSSDRSFRSSLILIYRYTVCPDLSVQTLRVIKYNLFWNSQSCPLYHFWYLYWLYYYNIQATPAMSTSYISILSLMSKRFFIPNIFSLYFFEFQLHLCRKRLSWSNGYLQVMFHALDKFSIIFATVFVEVLNRCSHGRHIVCFGYVHVLAEVRTSSKQQ